MRVPDHLVAEIIDGELITSPRPASPHARAGSVIGRDLGPFDGRPAPPGRPGGWWILDEPELHLGDDVLVPDLAAWRHERMPTIPNVAAFTLAPDWVCEVISPSTGRIDRGRKMWIYAREGVAHLWFVDPIVRTLEIYRLEAGRWIVLAAHGGEEAVQAQPFATVPIALGRSDRLSRDYGPPKSQGRRASGVRPATASRGQEQPWRAASAAFRLESGHNEPEIACQMVPRPAMSPADAGLVPSMWEMSGNNGALCDQSLH